MTRARNLLAKAKALAHAGWIPSPQGGFAILPRGSLVGFVQSDGGWSICRGKRALANGKQADVADAFRIAGEHLRRFAQHAP